MITSTNLYWSLPSPSSFCQDVTDAARDKRAVILNHPLSVNLMSGLIEGLKNANFDSPIILHVEDGSGIASLLAPHFDDQVMDAHALANTFLAYMQAIILIAKSERSHQVCMRFVGEFINELGQANGNVRLILSMHDAEWRNSEGTSEFSSITYDGALLPSEMQTYVSFKMLGRKEFGSTQLLRQLVTEFGSFDIKLADQLMALSESEVLNLPESLGPLLASDEKRWSTEDWLKGSRSLTCPDERHPLREWYLAAYPGPMASLGRQSANRRYWKACIKSITPWLEERRPAIQDVLRPVLLQIAPDGKFEKLFGNQKEVVDIDDLEFNDLRFQFSRMRERNISLTSQQNQAFWLCNRAKPVRDALAHSRKPNLAELQELIILMDDFMSNLSSKGHSV